ncbi:glycosyltransferase [Candidatus Bathyarchaeota archaeon]|nr:glycosyltransferase [Candidatus Bathyarchaeota archaeon]
MEEPLVSVITCAHNEEKYVGKCLASVRRALKGINGEIVFVADRCSDNTAEIAKRFNVEKLIIKTWKRWKNSYAESLQTGFLNSSGKYISIVDADIILPENFFKEMLPLIRGNIASVSARVETYPSTLLNRIIYAWEKTHEITPFGREPRGAARVIRREVLHEIGGFKDTSAPDTDLDIRLRKLGYRSIYMHKVFVWHIRENTLMKVVRGQLSSGDARYDLGVGFMKTLAHSVFRLRPLVICGWIIKKLKKD